MTLDGQIKLPAVFGRFVLLRRISRGGMGEIFLAKLGEIQGFEKPIVIKKILPDLAEDEEFLQRFIEEAQIAIKLSHGNIVPVYEVGKVEDQIFLALQYVEGRDLRSLLTRCEDRKERLPPDLCLYLIREITNGLAYAHRINDEAGQPLDLVHCDISPPNILVSWEGEVKIIDFGIAKSAIQRAVDEHVGFGKFGYMAPEQLIRGTVVDRRADIYSTGVILYELLTGKRVYHFPPGTDYRRVAREVTAGKISPPSERDVHLTDQFDNLVMRALRTVPEERYQSAEEFRDEVQQHLYSMNPTISADSLAAFMQRVFDREIKLNRQMLRSLSQTDLAPYRTELADGSSHTVSFALAGLWTKRSTHELSGLSVETRALRPTPKTPLVEQTGRGEQVEQAGLEQPVELTGPDQPVEVVEQSGQAELAQRQQMRAISGHTGTRRMSVQEQMVAVDADGHHDPFQSTYTLLMTRRRRRWTVILTTLGIGAVVAVVAWEMSTEIQEPPTVVEHVPKPRVPKVQTLPPLGEVEGVNAEPGAAKTAVKAPVPSTRRAKPKRGSRRAKYHQRRHKKPKRTKKRDEPEPQPEPPTISPAMVQKKFRRVRKEYMKFTSSYGKLLDSEWQKILFSNTYGNMDANKYRRLDEMLDELRRKMKRTQEGG